MALYLSYTTLSDEQLRLVMYMIQLYKAFRLGFHLFFSKHVWKTGLRMLSIAL